MPKAGVLGRDRLAALAGLAGPLALTAILVPFRASFPNTDAALALLLSSLALVPVTATIAPVLLVAVALAALSGGSSAAQRSRQPPPATAALVASRGQLVAKQAHVKQLLTLSARQSAEISSGSVSASIACSAS